MQKRKLIDRCLDSGLLGLSKLGLLIGSLDLEEICVGGFEFVELLLQLSEVGGRVAIAESHVLKAGLDFAYLLS